MKIRRLIVLSVGVVCLFCLTGCHKKERIPTPELTKEQKEEIKQVEVPVKRYEQALFQADLNNLPAEMEKLYGQYPDNLISRDCWKDNRMMQGLKAYLKDPTIKALYQECQKQYADMSDVQKSLVDAFKIYLTHFPNDSIPTIITLIPGLDFSSPSVFGYGNDVFICLDMYLGQKYKYYSEAGMPLYIAARCERKYMATDVFSKSICYRHLPDKTLLTLLDNMVDEGKKLFFTQTMFPNVKEQDIIGYSEEKYAWAKKYEGQVWQYFIENQLLYSKDETVLRRMIDETPFTRDFGNQSPGRIGAYIGWRIVNSYMANHKDITLEQLMQNSNAQLILKESYYKPIFNK